MKTKSPLVLLRTEGGATAFYVKHYNTEKRKYITTQSGYVDLNGKENNGKTFRTINVMRGV